MKPFVEQDVGINPTVLGVRVLCHNVSVMPLRKRPGRGLPARLKNERNARLRQRKHVTGYTCLKNKNIDYKKQKNIRVQDFGRLNRLYLDFPILVLKII